MFTKDPFDLHVLGTPLAFILSQDQTLQKNFFSELKSVPIQFSKTKSYDKKVYIKKGVFCQEKIFFITFTSFKNLEIAVTNLEIGLALMLYY